MVDVLSCAFKELIDNILKGWWNHFRILQKLHRKEIQSPIPNPTHTNHPTTGCPKDVKAFLLLHPPFSRISWVRGL